MTHVHAFGDDALGDLDAVAVAEAIRAGTISRAEALEAAIDRNERVNPALNALALECFGRARDRAALPFGGFFDGVPSAIKDNSDVAGLPTMKGSDAWQPFPAARSAAARGRARRDADPDRRQRGADAFGARHRRVLPGGRARLVQPQAARDR